MIHRMSLNPGPFDRVADGSKIIEVRLNDEKRRRIKLYNQIIFSKLPEGEKSLRVRVLDLYRFHSFQELFSAFPPKDFGNEGYVIRQLLDMIYMIYSEEDERKYGVLGIKIRLTNV